MIEGFDITLSKLLLEGKSIRRAIELAVEKNPEGYQQYIEELLDVKAWKEDKRESK